MMNDCRDDYLGFKKKYKVAQVSEYKDERTLPKTNVCKHFFHVAGAYVCFKTPVQINAS